MEDFFVMGLIMFIGVLVALVAVFMTLIVYFAVEAKRKKRRLSVRSYLTDSVEEVVKSKLPSCKAVYLVDNYSYQKSNAEMQKFYYDERAKKIATVNDADGEVCVAKFEEIVGYEVIERHVGNVCKELGLLIKFSSLDKPIVKYDLYFKETIGMSRDSAMFRTCKESLMQTTAVLDYIKTINNTSK